MVTIVVVLPLDKLHNSGNLTEAFIKACLVDGNCGLNGTAWYPEWILRSGARVEVFRPCLFSIPVYQIYQFLPHILFRLVCPHIERQEIQMYTTKNEPNAAKLMDSLRYLGYDNYSALCDLVDNAFDAEAKNVYISISQKDGDAVISIADDGIGMDQHTLDEALKLGSLTERNSASDLGKFGMGLVTASLSIAKKTSVLTRNNGEVLKSVTDVDEIKRRNEFCKYLGKASSDEVPRFTKVLGKSSGTIVELTKTDNLKHQNLSVFRNTLKGKLGQIYRHFLFAGKKIYVNDEAIAPRDPLMSDVEGTEVYSFDSLEVKLTNSEGKEVRDQIRVRIAVLPDFGADGNKERKINQAGQGFYILRNNREIADGKTLDLFARHNDLNRFRAEIFFSGTLDEFMGVNFTKREVDPTQAIHDKIKDLVGGQILTIRNRIKAARITTEDKEITHDESEKIISSKAHLLLRPKPQKETADNRSATKTNGGAPGASPSGRKAADPGVPKINVRFESVKLGKAGPIYEAEQVGKIIVIQWNVEHPFYQRFVLERKDDPTLRTSVDFLVYSLATAELMSANEDNFEVIQNIKSVMSSNLRSLLS